MRILVADDTPGLRLLVRRILDGHEVFEAGTGHEALQLLPTARPDVAILDVNMPGRTGLEVCRAIRQDPTQAATWVIVMTANGALDNAQRAFEAGADGFLAKPFSPRRLCELIDAVASGTASRPTP
jgi:CheY-like chemotaxis protein